MANQTLKLGSEEFTLSLNFNTTIALLAYQEALAAKGAEAGLEETDIRGLLVRIAKPGTPMSKKVALVRTMLWALIASDQHPEWVDDPLGSSHKLGTLISPFDVERVQAAVAAIASEIADQMVVEKKAEVQEAIADQMVAETTAESAGDPVAKE